MSIVDGQHVWSAPASDSAMALWMSYTHLGKIQSGVALSLAAALHIAYSDALRSITLEVTAQL